MKVAIKRFNKSDLKEKLGEALEWINWQTIIKPKARVFIKPNLTWPIPEPGVTTTPQMLESLVSILSKRTPNIIIGEADGGYHSFKAEKAFQGHKLHEIARKYKVKVVNLCKIKSEYVEIIIGSKKVRVELPSLLLHNINVFITMPVPKIHAMTGVSLGYKNQWGCIPNTMRLREHYQFNEKIVAINKILKPKIALYDGTYFLNRNGPQSGDAVPMDLIIASNDLGAGDFVCCKIMNINPNKIKHLKVARSQNLFPTDPKDIILNDKIENFNQHKFYLKRSLLNWLAYINFNSSLGTKLFYDSPLAGPIHKVLFHIRKNPLVHKILYGE